ncbi:hypothetical protein T440DRAFT_317029 [Plenodomus tracheiphilus IPT5]|uniref:Uncharacterized protein n=1 Tax=Plenodomus tracheiphilus IPT5 TaxID=1408161 RepID=A0A6A7AP13_9PLEO|nr:hypothetical protein T440DRAFT_317029 [Plenodomus tracheiphilus IPT5]
MGEDDMVASCMQDNLSSPGTKPRKAAWVSSVSSCVILSAPTISCPSTRETLCMGRIAGTQSSCRSSFC